MIGAFRIEAYVIASADGMLTDASGVQPASLHFEADQRHFKQGLATLLAAGLKAQPPVRLEDGLTLTDWTRPE